MKLPAFLILMGWALLASAQPITYAEYFWDSDPGMGQGIPIPLTPSDTVLLEFTASTDSLSSGFHILYARVKSETDTASFWSIQYNQPVIIETIELNDQLTLLEYYWDTDPGFGNGMPIPFTPSDNLTIEYTIPVDVGPGFHILYFRGLSTSGQWSLVHNHLIMVEQVTSDIALVKMEYFINEDPGLGDGQTLAFTQDTDVTINGIVDLTGLENGLHQVYFRGQAASGQWTQPFMRLIHIENMIDNNVIAQAEYFIDTDPGVGNGTSISFLPDDETTIAFQVALDGVSDGMHMLFTRVKDAAGKWGQPKPWPFVVDRSQEFAIITEFEYSITNTESGISSTYAFSDFNTGTDVTASFRTNSDILNVDSTYTISIEAVNGLGMHSLPFSTDFDVYLGNEGPTLISHLGVLELEEDFEDLVVAKLDTIFNDPDDVDSSMVYSWFVESNLVAASIDSGYLVLNSGLNKYGSEQVIVTATDDSSETITDTLFISINPINDAPLPVDLTGPGKSDSMDSIAVNINIGVTFRWQHAIDVDSDSLNYTLGLSRLDSVFTYEVGNDTSFAIVNLDITNPFQKISWWVDVSDYEAHTSAVDTFFFIINKLDGIMNQSPEIIANLGAFSANEDFDPVAVADLDTIFADPDTSQHGLSFVISRQGTIVTANLDSGYLNIESKLNVWGLDTLIIAAIDDSSASVADTLLITIESVNDAPEPFELASPGGIEPDSIAMDINAGLTFHWFKSLDVETDSVDYQLKVFTESKEPLFLNAGKDTSIALLEPDFFMLDHAYVWIVDASDGDLSVSAIDTFRFVINKLDGIINQPPVLVNRFNRIRLDEDFNPVAIAKLDTIFTDPDTSQHGLDYSVSRQGEIVTANLDSGYLNLTSVLNAFGLDSVYISAIDDSSSSVMDTLFIEIRPVNDAPTAPVLLSPGSVDSDSISVGSSNGITFEWTSAKDVDGDSVFYNLYLDDDILELQRITTGIDTSYTLTDFDYLISQRSYTWWVDATDKVFIATSADSFHFAIATIVGIADAGIPKIFNLHQNYPNPFNPSTTIKFDLPERMDVSIIVYNILGQQVRQLVNRTVEAGYQSIQWDGRDDVGSPVPSGVYLYRIITHEKVVTKKMTLIK